MFQSIFFCFLFFCCITAPAQDDVIPPVLDPHTSCYIGVKAGVGLSDMDGLPSEAYPNYAAGNRVGVQVGIVALMPVNEYWFFRPEIGYSSQGYRQSVGLNLFAETVKQGYIQVPLQMQYTSTKGHCFYSGPQAGFLVYNKSGYKLVDVAWNLGVALITPWRIGVDARYSAGLMNTVNEFDLPLRKAKNKVLQVGLVYLFAAEKGKGDAGPGAKSNR